MHEMMVILHAAHFAHQFGVPRHDALGRVFAVAQMQIDDGQQLNRDGAGRASKLLLQRCQECASSARVRCSVDVGVPPPA